jgi:hypothetical protein
MPKRREGLPRRNELELEAKLNELVKFPMMSKSLKNLLKIDKKNKKSKNEPKRKEKEIPKTDMRINIITKITIGNN